MKIILTNKPEFKGYSIEGGFHDGIRHFDHHGEYAQNPSPCNNGEIMKAEEDNIIEITHMDADTLCGIKRLLGMELPKVNLKLMEQIDNNGSSVCSDKFDSTLLYMLGVGQISRKLKLPRTSEERQDVTEIVSEMLHISDEEFIRVGKTTQEKAEQSYKDCLVKKESNKAFFVVDAKDALDPSRAYEDNIDIVVVYRQHYKSISIYCNPKSQYAFGGKEIDGIKFGGHPQACGSPRGVEMTEAQALEVWEEI